MISPNEGDDATALETLDKETKTNSEQNAHHAANWRMSFLRTLRLFNLTGTEQPWSPLSEAAKVKRRLDDQFLANFTAIDDLDRSVARCHQLFVSNHTHSIVDGGGPILNR